MRKDDSITFDAAAEAAAGAGEAFRYEEEGNVARYSGPLGTFTFDKTQFELRKHPVPATGDAPAADTIILKYIGTETDGRKISIPKGCTDISLMFSGTEITSAPRIPYGVKYAVGAFKDCDALADARGNVPRLPLTVIDSSYMFAGCTRLRSGPDIPGTVDAMDGMYYGCHALSRTPSIGGGVGTMDYAFADCPSLKQAPRVPKAAISARDVTACCPGIDAAKDRERSKEQLAGRDRYERKLDRKSLAGMIGSAFAACLQCHALRKQGYGLLYAPVLVHKRRQQGRMGTTLASGIADVLQAGETQRGLEAADGIRARERDREAAHTAWKEQKLAEWDRMYGDGTEPTRAVRGMAADGAKDWEAGLFVHMSHEPPEETWEARALRYQRQGAFDGMEAAVAAHWEEGELDEAARTRVAGWYRERLDETLAYYRSAKDAIENDSCTGFREDELRGLRNAMKLSGGPMLESVGRMQQEYHILDEGDLRRFDAVLKEMGMDPLRPSSRQLSQDLEMDAAGGFADVMRRMRESARAAAAGYEAPVEDTPSKDAPGKDAPGKDAPEEEEAEPVDPFRRSASTSLDADRLSILEDIARRTKRAVSAGIDAFMDGGKPKEQPEPASKGQPSPAGGKRRAVPDTSGIKKEGPGGHGGPTL